MNMQENQVIFLKHFHTKIKIYVNKNTQERGTERLLATYLAICWQQTMLKY
jgi:hypothetical protein